MSILSWCIFVLFFGSMLVCGGGSFVLWACNRAPAWLGLTGAVTLAFAGLSIGMIVGWW